MSDKTTPPDWALKRAQELRTKRGFTHLDAFAAYIAEHEQPPADPLLEEAREICAARFDAEERRSVASHYRSGVYDNHDDRELSIALAALKRGIEIEREKSK